MCVLFAECATYASEHCKGVTYSSDMSNSQWEMLRPLLDPVGRPGPKFSDLRETVNAMLYVSHTGCQWRYLPETFGLWTKVWSQFRRWRDNGTWERVLTEAHEQARIAAGRPAQPSMVTIDPHLARGASNGGRTFHDRGGPYGATKGAKRVVAVDITGLPVAARVVPASVHDGVAVGQLAEALCTDRLELLLVDRGMNAKQARALEARLNIKVERVGWDTPSPVFRPIRHAWRVEVAHGKLLRSRRLAKSFENTCASATAWLLVSCVRLHMGLTTSQAATSTGGGGFP